MLWWTFQNVVIAGLLAGLVQLVCRSSRIGPVGRHALWLIVLVKLLTPPLLVVHTPRVMADPRDIANRLLAQAMTPAGEAIASEAADAPPLTGPPISTIAETAMVASDLRAHPGPVRARPRGQRPAQIRESTDSVREIGSAFLGLLPLLAGIWIAGGLAVACVQSVRIVRIARRVRTAGPADPAFAGQVDSLAHRLRIRPVTIRLVPGIASPLIWGMHPGHPQLLWPAELMLDISDECRRGLVVHELAHVKRRDHWVAWIELAAACVWWWNPLFWYVRSQLRENAELACDGWVIDALPNGRRAYAEALLAVCAAAARRTAPMPGVGINAGGRRVLERRLTMIMQDRVSLRLSRVGVFSIAVLALVSLPAWATRAATREPQDGRPPASIVDASGVAASRLPPHTIEVPAETARQSLPADAQKLIDRFIEQQAEARREADTKIARQREELLQQLQAMQDTHTKAGRLDEAIAVRARIRQFKQGPAMVAEFAPRRLALDDPARALERRSVLELRGTDFVALHYGSGDLRGFRHRVGQSFTLPVVGSTAGSIWGDGVYTDDSSLAAVAVHAGVVAPGQFGYVRVTIQRGQRHYDESTHYGVTSQPYGPWEGSYSVERDPEASPVVRLPDDSDSMQLLMSLRSQVGVSLTIEVVGAPRGSAQRLWGTDVYTDDSSIAAAAVHAGILEPGQRGLVKVTIMPGQDSYSGMSRYDIDSRDYGPWEGSFRIERAPR